MSFKIVTDTSANLPAPILKANGVGVLPFTYTMDGQDHTCFDTEGFEGETGERYYAELKAGARVTTSQINSRAYVDFFEPILEAGEDLLFISMSSGISGSYESSAIAVKELRARFPERRIETFDTLAASLGEGKAVLRAVECRDSGLGMDETLEALYKERTDLYQVVLLDDLMYLYRGGRVAVHKALLGAVLGIRPLLKGNTKGELVVFGKAKGRKRALAALAEKYAALVDRVKEQVVGIAYTDCPEDAFALRDALNAIFRPKDIMVVRYEPVTGSYVGPGTVALFFDGIKNAREY
jgi:DegV family protein with EDD domain